MDAAPAWLHPDTRSALARLVAERGGISWGWSFGVGERAVLRHRKPIPVSTWAERHRVVHNSSRPGKWKNMVTPYVVGLMDAAFHPAVRSIAIMKCPQSAGTESVHNCIGYTLDRAPGPVLYVYPDETTARENAQDRIIPMIHASPRLREYLTGMSDDMGALRIKLAHTTIYMAWSGSASRLGNKPIRYLVLDELDKYQSSQREAAAESLAEKRVITWGARAKIWKLSTPTVVDGPIDRAFKQSEARFRYHVACPTCGAEQLMDFDRIMWPQEIADPVTVRSHGLGWYECEHCGARWSDADRDLAVRNGLWRDEVTGRELAEQLDVMEPISVGFHIPAWISPFVSLSEIAAKALEHRNAPSLELLKDLQNNYKGEPWEMLHVARAEDDILALCDDRPRGAVPGPVDGEGRISVLLAGVDTQKSHLRYVIRAWGWGENDESWLVQCGIAETLDALDQILWRNVYLDSHGTPHTVRAAMVDAMGSRTAEIYRYAAANRGRVFPWQGLRRAVQPYSMSPQEYYPDMKGNKVRIPGGINLWRCDTTFFKNDLAHKLSIHPDDPGAFHLHGNDRGELDAYAQEMCAEVWDDEQQAWLNPGKKANHYWDCEVMARALAYILDVRHMRRPADRPSRPRSAVRGESPSMAARLGSLRRF